MTVPNVCEHEPVEAIFHLRFALVFTLRLFAYFRQLFYLCDIS